MYKDIKAFLKNQYPKTEMAIGYIQSGRVHFKGFLKQEGEELEVDNAERLFEIGSIAKVFTSNVLAQLILEEKVKSNELIAEFLSHKGLKETGITLLSLANHTSGLPRLPDNFYSIEEYDERNPYLHYDEKALRSYLNHHLNQNSKVGEKFNYSNLNSGLLGYVISKIEAKPFQQIVEERIFQPLNMKATTFEMNTKEQSVAGLNKDGKPADYWEGGLLSGCIGIVSSAEDMTKWMLDILNSHNEVADLQLSPTFRVEEGYHISLGWGVKTLADGSVSYNHGGGSDGYSAYLKLHRASQSGVIMLTNISAFNKAQSMMDGLVEDLRDSIRK